MTRKARPLSPSQKLQLAVARGEASYPAPTMPKRAHRLLGRLREPRELAVRTKTGAPIGTGRR